MATITLGGGSPSEHAAVEVLSGLRFFEGVSRPVLAEIAHLLHQTYPGKAWIDPIKPDLLGEHLVERELGQDAEEIARP